MSKEFSQFSTFEVTLPKGANQDTLALYGLGNALGWNISERVALESDFLRDDSPEFMRISEEDLADVSTELFGTEVYGDNAAGFLEEQRREFTDGYYVYATEGVDGTIVARSELAFRFRSKEDGKPQYTSDLGSYSNHLRSMLDNNAREAEVIEELLVGLWPRTPYPFEVPKAVHSESRRFKDDHKTEFFDLEAGIISRLRLAHYARITGIARHALRGAIGKSHDVINVAAGLASPDELTSRHEGDLELEFINYEQFRDMLKDSGLTSYGQEQIRNPLQWNIAEQIRTGGVRWWMKNEVITEGSVKWVTRGGNRVPQPEKIAKVSLAQLLDSQPQTRNVAPRKFLKQFAE